MKLMGRWFLRVCEGTSRLLSQAAQEDGYSSEFAVITALAVGLGVAVAGIIAVVVLSWAHGVQTK